MIATRTRLSSAALTTTLNIMSASRSEIEPFFPSITHECIRVGMDILSKLRSRTGPGKGNDLKPEEYAALPGVSAFLAAERYVTHSCLEAYG